MNITAPQMYAVSQLVESYHEGQFRRDGTRYVNHLFRAKVLASKYNNLVQAVTLLHDSVEDERVSAAQLLSDLMLHAFSEKDANQIVVYVQKLDKKGKDYDQYIHELATDPVLRRVKMCDICDNLTDKPSKKSRLKYLKALDILTQAENQ